MKLNNLLKPKWQNGDLNPRLPAVNYFRVNRVDIHGMYVFIRGVRILEPSFYKDFFVKMKWDVNLYEMGL